MQVRMAPGGGHQIEPSDDAGGPELASGPGHGCGPELAGDAGPYGPGPWSPGSTPGDAGDPHVGAIPPAAMVPSSPL